jgi:platelet-activating factor acetylhydrolase IB subunit alpha
MTGICDTLCSHQSSRILYCHICSPDGALLASCSADVSIKLWDFKEGTYECTRTLRGHDHSVSAVSWLPDTTGSSSSSSSSSNLRLASCSRDSSIKIWDAATGYCIDTLSGHSDWVRSIAAAAASTAVTGVAEGSTLLASCGNDQSVRVWSVPPAAAAATAVGVTATAAHCVHVLQGHTHVVESVAFSDEAADAALATVAAAGAAAADGTVIGT